MNKIKYENINKENSNNLFEKSIICKINDNKKLKRNITKLLICGGGFKFFYLVGAIKYLHHINILKNIKEYIGISAGSMLALMFVLGYSTNDLNNFFLEFNFEKLISPDIESFFENKGLDNGEIKKIAIEQFLRKKGHKIDITFLELYQITNIKLTMIASNISKNSLELLNYETHPDLLITQGILMTSSLPILFEPVIYNNNYYVDGGAFDNYPIELFDDDNIIGINMITDFEDLNFDLDFFSYITKVLSLSWHFKDKNKTILYKDKTIDIRTNNPNELIDPNVDLEERIKRIQNGYDCAHKHFNEFEFIDKDDEDIEDEDIEDEENREEDEEENKDDEEDEDDEDEEDDEEDEDEEDDEEDEEGIEEDEHKEEKEEDIEEDKEKDKGIEEDIKEEDREEEKVITDKINSINYII